MLAVKLDQELEHFRADRGQVVFQLVVVAYYLNDCLESFNINAENVAQFEVKVGNLDKDHTSSSITINGKESSNSSSEGICCTAFGGQMASVSMKFYST